MNRNVLKQSFRLAGCLSLSILSSYSFGQRFVDATDEAGLFYIQQEIVESVFETHLQSGGAVAADFDGDGWTDLFVTRFQQSDILFRNLGPDSEGVVRFEDVSAQAGFTEATGSNGAVAVDTDNDGDLDLYLSTIYEKRFLYYLNQGDGTFVKDAGKRGGNLVSKHDHLGFSISAGDYNRDGWPDMHTNEWSLSLAEEDIVQHSVLLKNFGEALPGWFQNVTDQAGATLRGSLRDPTDPTQYGFSSSFVDLDGDGWQDLLVAADFRSSQVFWNKGDGTFEDGTDAAGIGLESNGMGQTVGDFDGDGLLDFFVSSIDDHRLYRNQGDRTFAEEANERIEGVFGWGWGSSFLDYDNDGDLDLALTTGYESLKGPPSGVVSRSKSRLWRNDDGMFSDVGEELGIVDDGPGKGLLVFDYDNDGDLDIFIVNSQSSPVFYRNDIGNANDWLRIVTRGRSSNRYGLGVRLSLKATGESAPQLVEMVGGSNYLGQNELVAHFGLGQHPSEQIHSLTIEWPSGATQSILDLSKNATHVVFEPISFEDWSAAVFAESDLEESQRAPSMDPDGDGLSNRQEYALGRNPLAVEQGSLLEAEVGSRELLVSYDRLAGANAASLSLEASDDLVQWTPVPPETATSQVSDFASETERVILTLDPTQPAAKPFLRLRIDDATE